MLQDPLDDLTADELDDIADTFWGNCNQLAYTPVVGLGKYPPRDTWPQDVRDAWDRNDLIARRFSGLADARRASG